MVIHTIVPGSTYYDDDSTQETHTKLIQSGVDNEIIIMLRAHTTQMIEIKNHVMR